MLTDSRGPREVISEVVSQWRDGLVNLSGRNRLLNFTATKSSTLALSVPDHLEVLQRLQAGSPLHLEALRRPLEEGSTSDEAVQAHSSESSPDIDTERAVELAVERDRTKLGAEADPQNLGRVLKTLQSRGNQAFADTGLWTIYLAFGMLNWIDPLDGKRYRSPLVLVPVVLKSPGPRLQPQMSLAEEDAAVNPALVLKMQMLDVSIPGEVDLDDPEALRVHLATVDERIMGREGWGVSPDVVLSYFTFHKEAMYRDLMDNLEQVLASEQVQSLALSGTGDPGPTFDFTPIDDAQIDVSDPPEQAHLILDADSSQRAAVVAAIQGHSFIVDGPPGTGKSQTIANLIAALISSGKSVLFVSEKAAALEVVRNRLADVGLGLYVLELHSHKATRKEVAEELNRALTQVPKGSRSFTSVEAERLKSVRLELSESAHAMNTRREPLGMSIHEAIGRVAMHDHLAATRPCAADLRAFSESDLASVRSAASRLAGAWRPAVQGESFLWRGVASRGSLDFEINSLMQAIDNLGRIAQVNAGMCEAFAWGRPSDTRHLQRLLELWANKPSAVPTEWLLESHFEAITEAVREAEYELGQLRKADADAESLAGPGWSEWPITSKSAEFSDLESRVMKLSPQPPHFGGWGPRDLDVATQQVRECRAWLTELMSLTLELSPKLGLRAPTSLVQIDTLLEVERLTRSGNQPEAAWFKAEVDQDVEQGVLRLREALQDLEAAESVAAEFFTDKVLDLDPEALLTRFENVHRGLRKLGGEYRADLRALAEANRPGLTAKQTIGRLPCAIEWKKACDRKTDLEAKFAGVIGARYQGAETDWVALEAALGTARSIVAAVGEGLRDSLSRAMGRDDAHDEANQGVALRIGELIALVRGHCTSTEDEWLPSELLELSPIEAQLWCDQLLEGLGEARRLLGEVNAQSEVEMNVGAARTACIAVEVARATRDSFGHKSEQLGEVLGSVFTGDRTDLGVLDDCVRWTTEWRSLIASTSHVLGNASGAISIDQLTACNSCIASPALDRALDELTERRQALLDAFPGDRGVEIQEQLDSWDEGPALLDDMRNDSAGQDEWFAYVQSMEELSRWGLAEVVRSAADARLSNTHLEGVVERELLRRWVDLMIEQEPSLHEARSPVRDQAVEEFRLLDRQLVESAVSRIVETASTRRPTSLAGQASVIVAEGRKKRRHMPIRELLSRTLDVTPQIKPVFMMSPLSVSQYLPPDIHFDVVVFDEASQVMPEDAINCIYRASELIIAGDEKQLPPTNFFALGSADDDAEWEEDQSAAKDFESVLSLAKASGAFRSLTLRWHYRSRHESLISFSNARFYEGELVTFPSSEMEAGHVGVELFVVPDGVYDRGGSRRNMAEARFVAQRVAHHFDTRPGMSLGVVAFSQAQADAVQLAVDELILERPELEQRLGGSRLDAFFVKNLESVQGDERDVLIFSVGYGPDADGKLTMNFGPINREGGWRRLNVAITRARFRNEVVASFQAAQMPHSSVRGVAELRRYLDYAANGLSALSLDDSLSLGDAESPFEESVLSWLRSEGYTVTPQVGSSGYRIDMAVHHPEFPSRFVLGIECDGSAYHSSRTARDRDRLREQVLTGLGWRLHRIWGTSWYRHRDFEKQRLREAIEKAIAAPIHGLLPRPASDGLASGQDPVELVAVELADVAEWVIPYEKADVPLAPYGVVASDPESIHHHVRVIEHVVSVEGPIHMDLVDQRLRESWSIGRIGAQIRPRIDEAIRQADVVVDGDFLLSGVGSQSFVSRKHDLETKREIRHIYPGELDMTVLRVITDAGAMSLDEVIVSSARHLGFARVGDDVRSAIADSIRRLRLAGRVSDGDDSRLKVVPA